MTKGPELKTERLLLRRWRESDRAPFAAMNADPAVMEHFVSPLSEADSDAFVDRMEAAFERDGYGLWAVEVRETGDFVGFTGLSRVTFDAPFVPAVEVGWRLAHHAWGRGFAPEAARAALGFAFDTVGLAEVVSFTAPVNERSQAVMRKIGMRRDPDGDFDHPRVPEGHPIRPHVLWRIGVHDWRRA
ncbi:Protein N-acetyltransferase, RimJ/RimL family [Actinopolymorpha cephalotaxi]|uniref:Protein N-acetyltransferase, RimJ/RimL family n=1 Tax=Actinopolymorpha cephalotaxi TaxID=504797 RepID=A0A1I2VHV1_9ACTN|nr:GNAT family N-acetyltransferase [Actinopolymorpha cephalotaxi]NYH84872.1 ribosomal-protein-alanine N-acetyltransferase [Actinopolymorpha cephalotaxi]SFG88009.1 Protein N-acetyltransferase, RimJ/RimL family [Actinopolymorpha cephalotaxi]